ncbi:MAG: Nif11-like leader peptide family RiPP precursor, partial [Ruminiclostridium sp.]|nr:Nif11-like leader peptide family RiPP precursor [Ruminiclostridium sp.]
MSKEAASKFVQTILNDAELRIKTAEIKPEEIVPFAKEMGYDFTLEELKEVKEEDIELSPEELESVAGGDSKAVRDGINQHQRFRNKINQA